MNEDLLRIVRANVREPLQVEGDIYACAACNDEGSRRLIDMMDEFEIANLDRLGETIIESSREATLARIRALPKGTYRNSMTMDGYDKPLEFKAALTISDDGIHVDFDGTSPASRYGINVVYNYCLAYTAFGVKCLVAPEVPNNAGSLAPITVMRPGRLRAQRQPTLAGRCAAHGRSDAAGRRVRLSAAGDARRRTGRRGVVAVESADLRRRLAGRRG